MADLSNPNPRLPDWTPAPKPAPLPASTGKGERSSINASAKTPKERTLNVTAFGNPLPIIYGCDRVGALLSLIEVSKGELYIRAIWAQGEIAALEKVAVDDDYSNPLSANNCVNYLGLAGQKVDPWLKAIIPTYCDTLDAKLNGSQVSAAYSVIKVPTNLANFPKFSAQIKGRKVFDPRDARQKLSDPQTWAWSDNAALCLADFISLSLKLPIYNLIAAANFCDELVERPDKTRTKRHTLNLALINRQSPYQWIETLAVYAQCFVFAYQDGIKLVPNGAVNAYLGSINGDDIKALENLATIPMLEAPTSISVFYTDRSASTANQSDTWRERSTKIAFPEVEQGLMPYRDSEISLPGICNLYEAASMARKRLELLNCDLEMTTIHHDDGLLLEEGGVYLINEASIGITQKPMRIIAKTPMDNGDWRINWMEYQPAVYTESLEALEEWLPDTSMPSPFDVPQVVNFQAKEDIYKLQTGRWASRILASWTMPQDYAYNVTFEAKVEDLNGGIVLNSVLYSPELITPALAESYLDANGKRIYLSYKVSVRAISASVAYASAWLSSTLTLDGKKWPPSDVPKFSAFERGGRVFASWSPAIDADIDGYIWGFVAKGQDWTHSSFSMINALDALRDETNNVPAGQWDLLIRARDSVGNLSVNATRSPINVTLDNDAYHAGTKNFNSTEIAWDRFFRASLLQEPNYIARDCNVDTFNNLFPNALNSYTSALLSNIKPGAAPNFVTAAHDFGAILSGDVRAAMTYKVLEGSLTTQLETSRDNKTWEIWPQMAAKTSARYARIRATGSDNSSALIEVTIPDIIISMDASLRSVKGNITTNSAGYAKINLSIPFVEIRGAPQLTPAGLVNAYFDNIKVGDPTSIEVWTYHAKTGAAVSASVYYEITGI